MKHVIRHMLVTLATLFLLAIIVPELKAQNTAVDSVDKKVEMIRQISWNIMKLVGGTADNFLSYKGDYAFTAKDGSVYYKVKNLVAIGADFEYIMINTAGRTYYLATFSGDDAKMKLYDLAFNYGIYTFDANKDHTVLASRDTDASTDETDIYYLTVKDTKVGKLSINKIAGKATVGIGFFN